MRLLAIALLLSSFVHAETYSLEELQQFAVKNNHEIRAKQYKLTSKEEQVNVVRGEFLPSIGLELAQETLNYDSDSEVDNIKAVYGEINLFNGFKDRSEYRKSKNNIKGAKINLDQAKFYAELEMEKLVYEYYFLKQKVIILTGEIRRTKNHIDLVRKRLASKLITETDLLEFQLYFKKLQSSFTYAKLQKTQILSEIKFRAGILESNKIEIKGYLPHLKLQESWEQLKDSLKSASSIEVKKLEIENMKLDTDMARSYFYPKVDLRVEHGNLDEVETGIDTDDTSSRVILSATWELFSGLRDTSKLNSYKNHRIGHEYELRQLSLDTNVMLRKNFDYLKMLEQTIESEEENEKIARSIYKRTLAEYKKGVKDSSSLADASKDLSEMKSRIFELKANYLMIKINLEKDLGRKISLNTIVHNKE